VRLDLLYGENFVKCCNCEESFPKIWKGLEDVHYSFDYREDEFACCSLDCKESFELEHAWEYLDKDENGAATTTK
jgi:hypothetical protein